MSHNVARTAEHVSLAHPDKFCDQVADRILDEVLSLAGPDPEVLRSIRTAVECLAKDNLLIVAGEVKIPVEVKARLDIERLARGVWERVGYGHGGHLTVMEHLRAQSPDIAQGTGTGVDAGGAGDQGIMVGYATDETPEYMPREWLFARNIIMKLNELRENKTLPWLRSDCKAQVSLNAQGDITSIIVAAQHSEEISDEEVRRQILEQVVHALFGDVRGDIKINGTGRFVIGGPQGDAGVVGRKIVVDAYGPRVPVGGGAYSGKDPTKVDRSAAYMARHIAKSVVAHKIAGAQQCLVTIAYGIGQLQPEMVTAITDKGEDISPWVKEQFPDLSPGYITGYLELCNPKGWRYEQTAFHGHYGREMFPWEKIKS